MIEFECLSASLCASLSRLLFWSLFILINFFASAEQFGFHRASIPSARWVGGHAPIKEPQNRKKWPEDDVVVDISSTLLR